MKIVYYNIIFSLQKLGGASVYWMEFISRIKNKNIIFYEQQNQNLFAKMIDYVKGLARFVHTLQKRFAIYFSDGVICISENTKRDLIKFCPFVNQKKIKVIYNGISEQFSILENKQQLLNKNFPELKDLKYFLFVGDRSAYKRFDIALELLNKLQKFNLVIVGGNYLFKGLEYRIIMMNVSKFKYVKKHKTIFHYWIMKSIYIFSGLIGTFSDLYYKEYSFAENMKYVKCLVRNDYV